MGDALQNILPFDARMVNSYPPSTHGLIPLPPPGLMWSVGARGVDQFLAVADIWGQILAPHLQVGSRVLDLGCGCGRIARLLLPHRSVHKYIGLDVVVPNIEWCNNYIQQLWPEKALFICYDLYSAEYNPAGKIAAIEFIFPCKTEAIDIVIAASLFTHLLEPDAWHYLEESARVLRHGGLAIVSIHTSPQGVSRFSGNEARVDIDPAYFAEMANTFGLVLSREPYFQEHEYNHAAQLIFEFQKT